MNKVDLNSFDAFIFDMDGTMINNSPYHKRAWDEFAKRHSIMQNDPEFYLKIAGRKNAAIFPVIFNRALSVEQINQYSEEKESLYRKLYENDIEEIAGLTLLINKLKSAGKKLALATTAPKKNRDFGLKALGLSSSFEIILGDEDVKKGKPDPEIYLKTSDKLNVIPKSCLVFEDTAVGVAAGKNAGMSVAAVLTSHTKVELSQADYFISDFTELL